MAAVAAAFCCMLVFIVGVIVGAVIATSPAIVVDQVDGDKPAADGGETPLISIGQGSSRREYFARDLVGDGPKILDVEA